MSTHTPQWSYLKNHTAQAVSKEVTPPWQKKIPVGIPAGLDKKKFRTWCADPQTDHLFFSAVEAVNQNVRPSADNPPHLLHGFVGDYDSDHLVNMTTQEICDEIAKRTNGKGILPNYLSRTFSNKLRLVWIFETPMPGNEATALAKAIDLFIKESKADVMIEHGLDKTSKDPTQFFEVGHSWADLQQPPVPSAVIQTLYFKAASTTVTKAEAAVTIPMEAVEAEIERQYPGGLNGITVANAVRVPLFWLRDGNPDLSAQVGENGIWSYSDRDPGFHPWSKLLGKKFVQDYETQQIGTAVDEFYFDGDRYWCKLPSGEWYPHKKEDAMLHIEAMGFSTKQGKQGLSPVKQILHHIQRHRRIDVTAPFLFNKQEVVAFQGKKCLNVSHRKPMEPAGQDGDPAKWPWLHGFLNGFLDVDPHVPTDPHDHLFAWIKRMWTGAREGNLRQGHVVVIAGEADEGKSLFSMFILRQIMGGGTDAGDYLLSGGGFNKEAAEVAIWNIDDQAAAANFSDHKKFTEMLKKTAANPEVKYHPKFVDSMVIPWCGRVVITCNVDASSLEILPTLDGTIRDKLMLLRLAGRKPDFPPSIILESTILTELPHFLDWLDKWNPPAEVVANARARYGVKEYHHTQLLREVRDMSQEANFKDLLVRWMKQRELHPDHQGPWKGTPAELYIDMTNTNEENVNRLILNKYPPERMGKMLKLLREAGEPMILKYQNGRKKNRYTIQLVGDEDDD